MPEFGVFQSCRKSGIEIGDNSHGNASASDVRQQLRDSVTWLPAGRSLVDIDQVCGYSVQFMVIQVEFGVFEGASHDGLPPIFPSQSGAATEVRMLLVHLAPMRFEIGAQSVVVAQHAVHGADFAVLLAGRRTELQKCVCHIKSDQPQPRKEHFCTETTH